MKTEQMLLQAFEIQKSDKIYYSPGDLRDAPLTQRLNAIGTTPSANVKKVDEKDGFVLFTITGDRVLRMKRKCFRTVRRKIV